MHTYCGDDVARENIGQDLPVKFPESVSLFAANCSETPVAWCFGPILSQQLVGSIAAYLQSGDPCTGVKILPDPSIDLCTRLIVLWKGSRLRRSYYPGPERRRPTRRAAITLAFLIHFMLTRFVCRKSVASRRDILPKAFDKLQQTAKMPESRSTE